MNTAHLEKNKDGSYVHEYDKEEEGSPVPERDVIEQYDLITKMFDFIKSEKNKNIPNEITKKILGSIGGKKKKSKKKSKKKKKRYHYRK